jgi:hypothetical protein
MKGSLVFNIVVVLRVRAITKHLADINSYCSELPFEGLDAAVFQHFTSGSRIENLWLHSVHLEPFILPYIRKLLFDFRKFVLISSVHITHLANSISIVCAGAFKYSVKSIY